MAYISDSEHQARLVRMASLAGLCAHELELDEAAQETLEKETEESRREVGYASRLLVQVTLPHSKPAAGVFAFERSNGFVSVKVVADPEYGLPYGTYPRLLQAWITTEAVRTKSPRLCLGKSMRSFLGSLGMAYGGGADGTVPRMRNHMQRLFTSTISATIKRNGEWRNIGFRTVEEIAMFWDPQNPYRARQWCTSIQLNQRFFEEIISQPVPIDLAAYRELSKMRSPMVLDIYQWMTHRFSYLRAAATIPWSYLKLQFGSDYARLRKFKEKFSEQMKHVISVYPTAKVEITPQGLKLIPSKTHVPMRLVKGSRKSR